MKMLTLSKRDSFVWVVAGLLATALMQDADAANGAIFVMLGVLALVLGLISLAGYSLVKRANLPIPPHVELVRSIAGPNLS